MAELSKRSKSSSWRLPNNTSLLGKRTMLLRAAAATQARKKRRQGATGVKRKRAESENEPMDTNQPIKRTKCSDAEREGFCHVRTEGESPGVSWASGVPDASGSDSGFSSEASPLASGRSSPCPDAVVALDCEMVGTGPGGCVSELARCSILDYHGNVLYDKYVQPTRRVWDYRTRWSGIRKHHLQDATPFAQAREEILGILEGKVVVGHSIHNDFQVLDLVHPAHMVRDTATAPLLACLAGFSRHHIPSLKTLAATLLSRRVQVGRSGHCSVEDARAALDLYKLVEVEWEQELRGGGGVSQEPVFAASNHYMKDEYWPEDLQQDDL